MNILYCSSTVSEKKFKELFLKADKKPHVVANRFHTLFLEGFDKNKHEVTSLSSILMNKSINKKKFWGQEEEELNFIKYIYLPFINRPILRQLSIFFSSFLNSKKWLKKNKNGFIVCDSLNIFICLGVIMANKLHKVSIITIVTDLPEFLNSKDNFINKLYKKLFNKIIKSCDGYVFLTEEMNKKLNIQCKPNIIIEGLVDIKMKKEGNIQDKYRKIKNIVYAGGLYKEYGIEKLIKAFMKIKNKNIRLDLFGDGPLVKEVLEYSRKDERIRYYGVVSNEEIIKYEMNSTILINPRPTTEEFTKYSFPSKNMEYMVSGTAVLTTKLPGMPKEYYDYVYLIEDESEEGIKKTLLNIFDKSSIELNLKGQRAKKFVLEEKNNLIQSQKIIKLVNQLNNKEWIY